MMRQEFGLALDEIGEMFLKRCRDAGVQLLPHPAQQCAVGGILYAVHNTYLSNHIAIRWYRIRAADNVLLESGTITDPDLDLFFPSIAANSLELIPEPLDSGWLKRARNSTSAEPLWEPVYRQAPLAPATLAKLETHPQFRSPS